MKYEWGLIDLKRLCDDIDYWQQHDDPTRPDYDTRDIDVIIGYQPIVEAIPVKWIENYITMLTVSGHSDHEPELEIELLNEARAIKKMLEIFIKE